MSARLATTEAISRIDLIASIWAFALLGVVVSFILSTLVIRRVTEVTQLMTVLVNALIQEKDSNKNVEPPSLKAPP